MSEQRKQIQVFQYEGTNVSFDVGESVMVNATEMAKRFSRKKKLNYWLKNKSTQEFIQEYSRLRKINLPNLTKQIWL